MTTFHHGSITEIPTTAPSVSAFRITGRVDDEDMEALAEHMNHVFDVSSEKVDILLDLSNMTGRDLDAMFDGDVLKAHFRSLKKVARYAVIGPPERAAKMIEWMDKVIPVEARAFNADKVDAAWEFVSACPKDMSQIATP